MKLLRIFFCILLVTMCNFSAIVYAEANPAFPFTVEMIPAANQIGNVGYYHIPGKPDADITLQARVTNKSDKSLNFKIVPLNAYSSNDGIFYQSPKEVDSTRFIMTDERYGLAQYIKENPPITLQAHQAEIVSISLTVPNLKGTILGSIRFVIFQGTQEVKNSDNKGNQLLVDQYQAMDTAIQIDISQAADAVVAFGNPAFNKDSANLNFDISNEGAQIQTDISGSYEISDKNNNKLFDGTIKSFKMAPMTRFQYPIPWNNKILEAGDYIFTLKSNVAGKEVNSKKAVVIENKAVEHIAEKQAEIHPELKVNNSTPLWIWMVIALLVVMIIFLFFLRKKPQPGHAAVEPKALMHSVEAEPKPIDELNNEAVKSENDQSITLSRTERHKNKR
jgi:hypothetical protein